MNSDSMFSSSSSFADSDALYAFMDCVAEPTLASKIQKSFASKAVNPAIALMRRQSFAGSAAVRANRGCGITSQRAHFEDSMLSMKSVLLRDNIQGRMLPWHGVEDRFDAAMTGGYLNFFGRSYPFVTEFCKSKRNGHLLAIGSEDGFVTVMDTSSKQGEDGTWKNSDQILHKFLAHNNAIFDLIWNNDDSELITASGDRTTNITDTETQQMKCKLVGHEGSVKTVATHASNPHIVMTGSRDGQICLFDTRVDQSGSKVKCCFSISNAHKLIKSDHSRGAKRKRVEFGTHGTVTAVKFFGDSNTIVSAGATDGLVKVWDARYVKNNQRGSSSKSLGEFCPSARAKCGRIHGITTIDISNDQSRLLVSTSNHEIYVYETDGLRTAPYQTLSGHKTGSFYVKTKFSPDGNYVFAGSSDCSLYAWQIHGHKQSPNPLLTCNFHEGEINGIGFCESEFGKLATCSDDTTVRLWQVDLEMSDEDSSDEISEINSDDFGFDF